MYEGDALFHLAYYKQKADAVMNQVEQFQEVLEPDVITDAPQQPGDGPIQ